MRYILAGFFILSGQLFAQEVIFTDRPNVTDAVALLNQGTFQVELGYFSNRVDNMPDDITTQTLPNYSFKYGLTDGIELRMLGNLIASNADGGTITGMGPISFSPKFGLLQGNGIVPLTSLAVTMTLPNVGREEFQQDEFSYGFRGLFEYIFGKVAWDNSIGFDWINGEDATLGYSSAVSYPLTDKFGIFGEIYGTGGDADIVGCDAGLTYLVNNNLQLDLILGRNLNSTIEFNDFGFGLGWKLN